MPRSRSSTNVNRLSAIAEEGGRLASNRRSPDPQTPQHTFHRPFHRRWHDTPPRPSDEVPPPQYNIWDSKSAKGERLRDLRNHRIVARRGGWWRLLLLIVLLVLISLGLGVGLGVGLTRRNSASSSSSTPTAAESSNTSFPAGAYALKTHLIRTDANCSAQASTWRCYPYSPYSDSNPTASGAVFNWVINASSPQAAPASSASSSDSSASGYTISSSANPFAITFANVTLALVDSGTPNERYTFSLPLGKYVAPSSLLAGQASTDPPAGCYFNATTFVASLYTKKTAASSSSSSSSSSNSTNSARATPSSSASDSNHTLSGSTQWPSWPYAVDITQSIAGGTNVPNCYAMVNGVPGQRLTQELDPQPGNQVCTCEWRNYDL